MDNGGSNPPMRTIHIICEIFLIHILNQLIILWIKRN